MTTKRATCPVTSKVEKGQETPQCHTPIKKTKNDN